MTLATLRRDERGVTAVEFAITAPAFFLVLFGIIQGGLLLWTQIGLQHGTEMAARCAGVNKTICGNNAAIAAYAATQAYGLTLPPSTFTITNEACGIAVRATYTFSLLFKGLSPTLDLNAQACFPT